MGHASRDGLGKMFVDKRSGKAWQRLDVEIIDCSKKGCWSWAEHNVMKVSGKVLSRFGILNDS